MTHDKFERLTAELWNRCDAVLAAKSLEYSPGDDRLAHFKLTAQEQDVSAKHGLWLMAAKHITSLSFMCRDEQPKPINLWEEKITDCINYMALLWALVYEEDVNGV